MAQVTYNKHLDYMEYNTKHAHHTHVKHINIIRKLVPSVYCSRKKKKKRQIKLGDAGTKLGCLLSRPINCHELSDKKSKTEMTASVEENKSTHTRG